MDCASICGFIWAYVGPSKAKLLYPFYRVRHLSANTVMFALQNLLDASLNLEIAAARAHDSRMFNQLAVPFQKQMTMFN